MPIRLNRFSECPNIHSAPSAPVIASGSASITVSGCTRLSNCAASTMKITRTPSAIAMPACSKLSAICSALPASAIDTFGGRTSAPIASATRDASSMRMPSRFADSVTLR